MLDIDKPYSFNALAHVVAKKRNDSEQNEVNYKFDFSDCSATVKGVIKFYYDIQKQTHEHPGYADISDVFVEIHSVVVDCENKQTIMTIDEKDKLEKLIKEILK